MKKDSLFNYLIAIAIITVIFGVIYATVQQSYRTGANDPQIQIAQDINSRLHDGKSVDRFFTDTISIAQSLSPFVVLYDANGKSIQSSGYLDGKMPELPKGVFDFTKANGEDRITWQPKNGVRMAMVILYSNIGPVGFIAAGRSLQEVETREHNLVTATFIGLIVCMGMILLYAVIQFYRSSKFKNL
jgi:hypothetical protein